MIEIIIFIIIVITIIILVECLSYIRTSKPVLIGKKIKDKKINPMTPIEKDTSGSLLNKYSTNSDAQIDLLPGKLMIDCDSNIFIKIKENIIIPDNKVVYNIKEPFIIEIINLKRESIIYYYKKS